MEYSYEQIVNTLTALGFICRANREKTEITVIVPYWRSDIKLPVDVVEEVARIIGYDKIPMTLLGEPIPPVNSDPVFELKRKIRQSLVGFGFQDIVTYTLIGGDSLNRLFPEPHPFVPEPVRLSNPMTADQEFLRPTLRAHLLAALAANRRYEENGIRLFEIARVYIGKEKGQPEERERLCGALCGLREDKSCHAKNGIVDFYDTKGVMEALLEKLGIQVAFAHCVDESLNPNKQAAILIDGKQAGVFGEVHPKVAGNFELNEPVYLFELDLNSLLPAMTGNRAYRPLPKFPEVVRDIALVLDIGVPHQNIIDAVHSFSLVTKVEVFDVYTGEQVPAGKKSVAYRLTFQNPTRTLKEEEINGVMKAILKKLAADTGATLRG